MTLLVTLAVFGLGVVLLTQLLRFLKQRIGGPRRGAYTFFFIGGAAIATFHLKIFGGGAWAYQYVGLIFLIAIVAFTSFVGLAYSLPVLKDEKTLMVIVGLTVVLVTLQYASFQTDKFFIDQVMRWYARIYALVCLVVPVAAVLKASRQEPRATGAQVPISPWWRDISLTKSEVGMSMVIMAIGGLVYLFVTTFPPPQILGFEPVRFKERAESKFFYSIGPDLKYSDWIDPDAETLVTGLGVQVQSVLVSPNSDFAAVLVAGELIVVSGDGSYRHTVVRVDSDSEPKTIAEIPFNIQQGQWSRDAKTLYLTKRGFAGELWKFDIKTRTLEYVLSPFDGNYFFDAEGDIYFSVLDQDREAVLHRYDGVNVTSLEVKSYQVLDLNALQNDTIEQPFHTFWQGHYHFLLTSKGVSFILNGEKPTLFINGQPILEGTRGEVVEPFLTGGLPFYSNANADDFDHVFLPGGRYLLFNVNARNYVGQLLIDTVSGEYKTLPRDTKVYPLFNTDTYKHFKIVGWGILPIAAD